MDSGFASYKDILDVVVVPITLALLAILFPAIKSWYIRRRFKKLILRELREISPSPKKAIYGSRWSSHHQKRCIHKEIFKEPSENRDFILSLPPSLVYYLSNLWDDENENDKNAKQWLEYLSKLKDYFGDERLNEVYDNWVNLIEQYKERNVS